MNQAMANAARSIPAWFRMLFSVPFLISPPRTGTVTFPLRSSLMQ